MNESLQLLEKVNWFLKPISDVILYLFTTTGGIIIISILFGLYLVVSVGFALHERKLVHLAARSSYERGHVSIVEKIYIILKEIGRIFGNLFTKIPLLIGLFIFFFFIVGFSNALKTVSDFVNSQQRIKELQTVVKHLDKRHKVAEMEILDQIYSAEERSITTKLKLTYFDYAGTGYPGKPQVITIKGNDIYFDAIVMNFEYSEIVSGNHVNISLPYRVFSNVLPQSKGVKLDINDQNGIPYIFNLDSTEIYGIQSAAFNNRVKEILEYMTDENKAKQAGVRSMYGNAVHTRVWKDALFTIWIEQTGGLVIKQKQAF